MTDRFDDMGRDAADAVRTSTRAVELDGGVGEVLRRGTRRAYAGPVIGAVAVVALAVPAVSWLLDGADPASLEVSDTLGSEDPETPPAADDDPVTGDGSGSGPGSDEGVPVAPADDGEESTGPDPLGEFSTDEVMTDGFPDADGPAGEVALLTDVRIAGQDGFDRVVLEFEGEQMSPYRVGYVDGPVRQDGSGHEVELPGEAFLEVRLTAASGVVFDVEAEDGYRQTYTGPDRVDANTSVVTEAVRTGDFEATLTWTLGLQERSPFSVTVLEDPLRLVVDVAAS